MEGVSDLFSALESSSLDEGVKRFLKDVVVAHLDGKGVAAMDEILSAHAEDVDS